MVFRIHNHYKYQTSRIDSENNYILFADEHSFRKRSGFEALVIIGRTSVIIGVCFLDHLPHPAAHTEQMSVESIFPVPIAALTP